MPDKIKVMSVFGTRPDATKMCPLVKELYKRESIEQIVCVTAQHRDMLNQVLNVFDVKPDYDLNIMQHRQTLAGAMTRALAGLEEVIQKEQPDLVLAHGDTTTAFAASLAAFYNKVKVGHVEAGLRSYDKYQPYPEEINRKLISALADIYFAPTQLSKEYLLKENIDGDNIFVTGNTSVDCVKGSVRSNYIFHHDILNKIDYQKNKVILMTAHRQENLGEPLENICKAVAKLADENPDIIVVYPVHLNPAVQEVAKKYLSNRSRIYLLPPLDMLDLHNAMNKSYLVLTDSGGLQEEAPSFRKPVVVLRNVTERPEGLHAGTLKLAGTDIGQICGIVSELLNDSQEYSKMASSENPFGDGNASIRIADVIEYSFGLRKNRPEEYITGK